MKVWGKIRKDNSTIAERVVTVQAKTAYDVTDWNEPFIKLCHDLNLSRPVILKKHIRDMEQFRHAIFLPDDFMEPVDFDRFEIELY